MSISTQHTRMLSPSALASAIAACMLAWSASSVASTPSTLAVQNAPASAQAESTNANSSRKQPKTLQAVEVLGSRIPQSTLAGHQEVVTITSEQIKRTGLATIGQVLQQLSVAGAALNSSADDTGNIGNPPNGAGVGAGAIQIALRNLGAQRTLVLVDGIRWVNGSSASGIPNAVDLNTIPLAAIERIEVLPDGASSLYGSDAIGGVINIITKKFQAAPELSVYYGDYTSGGPTKREDLTFGGQGDRYSYFMDVGHFSQSQIMDSAWSRMRNQCFLPGTGTVTCSSDTPLGRFQFPTIGGDTFGGLCPSGQCDVQPNPNPGPSGVQPFPSGFHPYTSEDGYHFANDLSLLSPVKITNLFATTTYNLTGSTQAWVRAAYSTRTSSNIGAPEAVDLGPGICAPDNNCVNAVISDTNPYNPFGFTLGSTGPYSLQRRIVEGGPRIFSQKANTFYLSGGLKGTVSIADHDFDWDVNLVGARNNATQTSVGQYLQSHVMTALGPAAACAETIGCVPLNIFGGPGTITPEMLDWIEFFPVTTSHQGLQIMSADVSGKAVRVPSGWAKFAVGFEHRNESGSFTPDASEQNGDDGTPELATKGGFSVNSEYGELNIPILEGASLAKSLNLDMSMRHSDYSTFGSSNTRGAAVRWQPVTDVTFRGSWGQGFRAPAIGELFGTVGVFTNPLVDPCNFNSNLMDQRVEANCKALGVPDPATFQQANLQTPVSTGGNPALRPETSRNVAFGVVYSPSWVSTLGLGQSADVKLDYYHVILKNAIEPPNSQTIVNECALTLEPTFCDAMTRGPTGQITDVLGVLENIGRIDTDGIDASINWRSAPTGVGVFTAEWAATYVNEYRESDQATGEVQQGTVGVENISQYVPRWRSRLIVGWSRGDWSASWTARFISGGSQTCASGAFLFPSLCADPHFSSTQFPSGKTPYASVLYNDLRVSWLLPIMQSSHPISVSMGVNNFLNRQPPLCLACQENAYDQSLDDVPAGAFWYVSATARL